MNIDLFQIELNEQLKGVGRVSIVSTSNIPGAPMPRKDTLWLVEENKGDVDFHIKDLQQAKQTVVFDIKGNLSLNYTLGTPLADVKAKINASPIGQLPLCAQVVEFVRYIDEAYNGVINYDKACIAYNQYISTGQTNKLLLQKAWGHLNSIPLHFPSAQGLSNAISAAAKSKGITL